MPRDKIEINDRRDLMGEEDSVITDDTKLQDMEAAFSLSEELESIKEGVNYLELMNEEGRAEIEQAPDPILRDVITDMMSNSDSIINSLKDKLDLLVDNHLGAGALAGSREQGPTLINTVDRYSAWGASKENIGSIPMLPVAEAGMIKELVKVANSLDKKGLVKEADYLDTLIKRSQSRFEIRDMQDVEFVTIPDVLEIRRILPDLSLGTIRDHAEAGNLARLRSLVETHEQYLVKVTDITDIDSEVNNLMAGGDPT